MEFFEALWREFVAVTEEAGMTLTIIILSIFLGFIIAIIATLYNKLVNGSIVRALLKGEVHCEEKALTAKGLGCDNPFVRFALRKNSGLRRVVWICGDTEAEQGKFERSSRLYIPEEKLRRAEITYGKDDITVGKVILTLIGCVAVAIIALIFLPDILKFVSNFIESITPKDNYV